MASRVGLALFGLGRMGYEHARNILMTSRASLNWIICENIEDAKRLQRDFKPDIKYCVPDQFEQALKDAMYNIIFDTFYQYYSRSTMPVGGVVIASPTKTHEQFIRKSLEAGKAVMCEKPLTSTLDSTNECYELAEKQGRPLLCAFNRRFDSSMYKLYREINSGKAGKVRMVKSISRDYPFPPLDYLRTSGGIFVDSTVHDLDMCSWLAGSRPKTVFAHGSSFNPDVVATGDHEQVVVIVTYENGAVSVTDNGRHCPFGYDQRLEVLCDNTMLTVENKPVDHVTSHGDVISAVPRIELDFMNRYRDAYRNELEHFLDVMEGKADLRVTKEDTLRTIRLVTLCYESVKSGKVMDYKE